MRGGGPYLRDLDTGVVGIVTTLGATEYSPSHDARFVAFSLLGQQANVYVRDRQNATTVLASRADGPGGAPANQQYGFMRPSLSRDGRFVAFQSTPPLDPVDTDAIPDIYVRDLLAGTTTLVSRASGATGVKGNDWSERPSISGDGRYVAFETEASNLSPDDTDGTRDIHVRDLVADTTTLVSRWSVTGNPGDSFHADISPDGRFVAFDSKSTRLAPGEDDAGSEDIYVRDLQMGTSVLASPGTGTVPAESPTLSGDGNRVAFHTRAQLLPEDMDGQFQSEDVYLRNIQSATTTLVSRASGAAGADSSGFYPAISDDARYVAFATYARNLTPDDPDNQSDVYVRDLQDHVTSLESRATPGYERYVRPAGATPIRVPLVPAYTECVTPNRTHGPPLAYGSCAPPGPVSPHLTVGVRDIGRSLGYVRFAVNVGSVGGGDDADVNIRFSLTNVMNAADFSDYTGELRARATVRVTDKSSETPGGTEFESTVSDFPFEFTTPCVEIASTAGSTCSLTTTADAIVPGFAPEGIRTVYGLDQVKVFDGGPDGDADTADNSLFAVQGLFVP